MGFHEAPDGGSHCYFARQPATPAEVVSAVAAVIHSRRAGLRYGGSDPAVITSRAEEGASECCDALGDVHGE